MPDKQPKRRNREQMERAACIAPQMTILTDGALAPDEWRRDSFGLHRRLAAVYDILRHEQTDTPLAIALYGDWGTGKTTAMRWLQGRLEHWNRHGEHGGHKKARTVWFEPWKYHTKEDVWRGLIAEVVIETLDVRNATAARVIKAAKEFGLFLGRGFLNVLRSTKLSGKVGGDAGGAEAQLDLACVERIVEDYKQTSHPEIGFLNEFEHTLRRWVTESLSTASERMVIFIDDLDRCMPEVALQVLEALKLYLRIPDLVFVVGVDRRVVDEIVRAHYEKLNVSPDKSRHYLAKMFQVEVNIAPSEARMKAYLDECLTLLDKRIGGMWLHGLEAKHRAILVEVLRNLAERNPREVKRLLNSSVQLAYGLLQGVEEEDEALRRLTFAQGIQSVLLGRILDSDPRYGGADLLTLAAVQTFFSEWSAIAVQHPQCEPPRLVRSAKDLDEADDQMRQVPARLAHALRGAAAPLPEGLDVAEPYKPLLAKWQRDPSFPAMRLWLMDRDVWRLMHIPFSAGAAAEASAARTERAAARPELPDCILGAVASSLGKKAAEITTDDLARVAVLDLRDSGATDADLPHLSRLAGLQALSLIRTGVTDAGLSHLSGLTGLTELYLSSTGVTDSGLSHLSGLTGLEILWLNETGVTDSGLSQLSGLTGLQVLDLRGTRVTDSGLTHLSGLTALRVLAIGGTGVTGAGLSNVSGLTGLLLLDLRATCVTDAGLAHLSGLASLRELDLAGTCVTDAGLAHLSGLAGLRVLILNDTGVTGSGLSYISGLTGLTQLYLSKTGVTDAGLSHVSGMIGLRQLGLGGTCVTDAGLSHLSGLTGLYGLSLTETGVTDAGLSHLSGLTGLRRLRLTGTAVTEGGAAKLAEAVPKCEIIR